MAVDPWSRKSWDIYDVFTLKKPFGFLVYIKLYQRCKWYCVYCFTMLAVTSGWSVMPVSHSADFVRWKIIGRKWVVRCLYCHSDLWDYISDCHTDIPVYTHGSCPDLSAVATCVSLFKNNQANYSHLPWRSLRLIIYHCLLFRLI